MSYLYMSYYIEETAQSNKRWISQCSKTAKIGDFLLVVRHWNEIPIPNHLRYSAPNCLYVACSMQIVIVHARYHDICKIKVYI